MMPATLGLRSGGAALPTRDRPSRARLVRALRTLPWRPVLLSWLAARAVVLLVLLGVHLVARHEPRVHELGLLSWDASWYRRIAIDGYSRLPGEALRFFPLLPLLARGLAVLTGSAGVALLVVSNVSALAFGLLLHRLAVAAGLGPRVADRAVWAAAFAPAAFVDVMGYTEPLYGALVCGLLLACRGRRWWSVALLGALIGALRPPGVVLAAVVLLAALQGVRGAEPRELLARAAAVTGPVAGLGAYLAWVGWHTGDPFLPFDAQLTATLRGGTFVDPLPGIVQACRGALAGQLRGSGLHVIWAAAVLGLLVVVWRRLPAHHTLLAALTIFLAVTARSMTSFERYAGSVVPLLLAVGIIMSKVWLRRVTIVVAPLLLGAYAATAFTHVYVP